MEQMVSFHDFLLWVIFAISLFVLLLLLYTIVRFREKAKPNPTKTTHNTLIEILWTVIPVLILFVIGFYSLPLLYATDDVTDADVTVKVIGRQWYWSSSTTGARSPSQSRPHRSRHRSHKAAAANRNR